MFKFCIWLLFLSTADVTHTSVVDPEKKQNKTTTGGSTEIKGSGLNNWVELNSKCLQANAQDVSHANAVLTCQKSNASLYSVKDKNELTSLSKILDTQKEYWTSAKFDGKDHKWEDGRHCCPLDWWGPNEPNQQNSCIRLKSKYSKWLLYDWDCQNLFGSICVKDRASQQVRRWKPVTVYDLQNLCGVEIMPNCGGLRCEDVCQSHHDCDQFAEMANVCVNMKNISETDNCVVKLRPNLTLYRLEWNC